MMENVCPICQANGLKRRLILFQLNLEEAILLCENKEVSALICSYLAVFFSSAFSKVSVESFGGLVFAVLSFLQCVYPLGVTDNANLIVSRKASEFASLNLKKRRRKRPKQIEEEVTTTSVSYSFV